MLPKSIKSIKRLLKLYTTILIYKTIGLLKPSKQISFKSILVIAPHPDDEVIGLGGIMLQTLQTAGKVNIVILTDGEESGSSKDRDEIRRIRIDLSEKVAASLSIPPSSIIRLHLPDSLVPHKGKPGFNQAVEQLAQIIEDINPDAVFATHPLDYNPYDHVACSQMAIEAVKLSAIKPELWFYWVWAWYNLVYPAMQLHELSLKRLCKIDISAQLAKKNELIKIYLDPLSPQGTPWSGQLPEAMLYPHTKPYEFIEKY